jgi:hypothetical protein
LRVGIIACTIQSALFSGLNLLRLQLDAYGGDADRAQ